MTLILEKDKLIESIWEYRWWIMENRFGAFVITIFKKKQYKETRGKHIEVAPRDIIKAKKQGLSEWFNLRRGYKGIEKWFIQDDEEAIFDKEDNNNPDYFHLHFGNNDLEDFKQLTEMNYEQLVRLAYALHTYLSRHQPLKRSDYGTMADTWKAREELQYELMEDVRKTSLTKIRNILKKWVADDSHYMDERLGEELFRNIYADQEGDYIEKHKSHCFTKALKTKTEKSEKYWYSQYHKFDKGFDFKEQAYFYWENDSKKINTDKHRAEYFQSIEIDLDELSYKPQN